MNEDEETDEQSETTDENTEAAPEGAEGTDGSGEPKSGDEDPLRDALKREQARNAKLEDRIEELESGLEAARGDESEQIEELREKVQELEQENERLRTESRDEKIDRAILEQSQAAGVEQTDVAKRLIDRSELELTDDGEVAGVEAELSRLEKEYRDQMPGLWGDAPIDDEDDSDGATTTSSPDSGSSKSSDRSESIEPQTDEELGAALGDALWPDDDDERDQSHI